MTVVDDLSVKCPYCAVIPGGYCTAEPSLRRARTHAARRRLALAVAAHADPMLDGFPGLGPTIPCGLCGTPGLPQRHRVIDAIANLLAAGEDPDLVADEYGVSPEGLRAVEAWAAKWPGAWQ